MADTRWDIAAALVLGSLGQIASSTGGYAGNEIQLSQSSSPPLEEVSIVYHTITWTVEPDGKIGKRTLLAQAEACMRETSREAGEACLRKNGWKPAGR